MKDEEVQDWLRAGLLFYHSGADICNSCVPGGPVAAGPFGLCVM